MARNAIFNQNCPPEFLKKVLDRGDNDDISQIAAMNLNCSPEALIMVLERGNDDWVSKYAAENINCPPEIKIKWMREMGKITRFNPEKHKISEWRII